MTASPKTILLVDDNDDLRQVTEEILESLGYRVAKAARGEMALKLYERLEGRVELLLTEFALPGMNGLELADRLKEQAPELGVLIVSTHDNHPELSERLRGGPVHFLRKPFSVEELGQALLEAARQRREEDRGVGSPPQRAGTSPPAASHRRWWIRWATAVAVGVLVLVVAGLARVGSLSPPALPELGGTSVQRGTTIEALSPVGVVPELPRELRWEGVEEAESYEVSLLRVDDTVLWRARVSSPRAPLPESLLEVLHPRVIYTWKVEALDSGQRRLAGSGVLSFEAIPAAGEEGRGAFPE